MERLYTHLIQKHFSENRQMLFLAGPRQVGKTTLSKTLSHFYPQHFYLNFDVEQHQKLILSGQNALQKWLGLEKVSSDLPLLVLDELHKYRQWKNFLKGLYDQNQDKLHILVTGSSRLDVYRKGQDSLMGRYFASYIHPLSLGELLAPGETPNLIRPPRKSASDVLQALIDFGGFPEPFSKASPTFFRRWQKLKHEQLFREDIRDLAKVQELKQLELYAKLLVGQVGSLVNFDQFAKKLGVSGPTIKHWSQVLDSFYYCFSLQPWSENISRSLLKQPKIYLRDWSMVEDRGARLENMVACHLLKAVELWQDCGLGDFGLYFVRDKQKNEVDFLVTQNQKPWLLVEVKNSGNQGIPKALYQFQQALKCPHAFMVVFDQDYINIDLFSLVEPKIVPAATFLSQLV